MSTQEMDPSPPEQKRDPSLAFILQRWQWAIVAALCMLAVAIRTLSRFDLVFQPGFVNFLETDAWYHVRVAENLIRHFPYRSMVDPYVIFGKVSDTATAPFYDWLLGLIAWVAGAGAPSESLLHVIAAWYPVALAVLTVVAVFLLARSVFGLRAALLAAAVIATLPGHFLRVSTLGFTDHHIMESLLVTLYFLLLLGAIRRPPAPGFSVAAGLVFGAYLLTFHGSAFVIGVVVAWALYDRIRWFQRREISPPSFLPLYLSFLIALGICLPFRHTLWMNYSIAALGLGALGIAGVELWGGFCRRSARPGLWFYGGLLAAAFASLMLAALFVPSLRHAVRGIVPRLMPAAFGTSRGVWELQSLLYDQGHFTLLPALRQFYGAYFLALIGMVLLAKSIFTRADPGRALIFFWGITTFVLAMGQLRMTYYFAVAVALISGYVGDILFAYGRKTAWVTAVCLLALVFAPNLNASLAADTLRGVSPDWREALHWMRTSTSEPFGDPAFYYARYRRGQYGPGYRYPSSAYSVMAWWDYGYWIIEVARRIPVTNPTQANAGIAADFFLSQSEQEAIPLLQIWRTRYVVVDDLLPLWPSSGSTLLGDFPQFFEYSSNHRRDEYLMMAYVRNGDGTLSPKVFYLPAYYRSMAVRLFVFGGHAVDGQDGATILSLTRQTFPGGKPYQEVADSRRYQSAQQAQEAEAACRNQGCVLVSDDPMTSCVPLDALRQLRPVFSSSRSVLGFGSAGRKSVQVYEFTGAKP